MERDRDPSAWLQIEDGLPPTGNFQIPRHRPGSRAPPSQSLLVPLLAPVLFCWSPASLGTGPSL